MKKTHGLCCNLGIHKYTSDKHGEYLFWYSKRLRTALLKYCGSQLVKNKIMSLKVFVKTQIIITPLL